MEGRQLTEEGRRISIYRVSIYGGFLHFLLIDMVSAISPDFSLVSP